MQAAVQLMLGKNLGMHKKFAESIVPADVECIFDKDKEIENAFWKIIVLPWDIKDFCYGSCEMHAHDSNLIHLNPVIFILL